MDDRGPKRRQLLLLAALYLVLFLAFDLAYGRFGLPDAAAGRPHAVAHPVHHHALAARVVDSPDHWGPLAFRVTTNSLGMRDVEAREVPLRATRRPRVLLLGDSFTFGVGYDYPRTFAWRFGAWLAARGGEVLNAAVVSYSPVIHVRRLHELVVERGLELDEVIVFLDVSDTKNDALDYEVEEGRVVFAEERRWSRRLARRLPITSGIASALRRGLGLGVTDAEGWSTRGSAAGMWTVDEALYEAWGRRGQQTMAHHMDALLELVAPRGIELTVAVYPWPDQILSGDLDSRHVRFWQAWCAARGVRFWNFFPDFVGSDPAANRAAVERWFIPDDIHFDARGHRYFAERVIAHYSAARRRGARRRRAPRVPGRPRCGPGRPGHRFRSRSREGSGPWT